MKSKGRAQGAGRVAVCVEDVLPIKSLEYFLSSQHWLDAFPPPREPHYERLCASSNWHWPHPRTARCIRLRALRQELRNRQRSYIPRWPIPWHWILRRGRIATPEQLHKLEIELARYIGPVAKHLVRHAAASSTDLQQLTLRLSAELDSEQERQKFMGACRALGASPL